MVPQRETRDFGIQSIKSNLTNLLQVPTTVSFAYKHSEMWRPLECGKLKATMVSDILSGLFAYKQGNMYLFRNNIDGTKHIKVKNNLKGSLD